MSTIAASRPRLMTTIGGAAAIAAGSMTLGAAAALSPALGFAILGLELTLVLMLAVWRRPAWGLVALIVLLPIYQYVFARLYLLGAPVELLRPMRFWKEVVVATLALKVVHDGLGKLDATDKVAIAFLALIGVFFLAPGVSLNTKMLAAREDGFFVVLFLVARHLRLPGWLQGRLESVILAYGLVMGGFAFMNHFAPKSWIQFINDSGLNQYRQAVLNLSYGPQNNLSYATLGVDTVAGHSFIRAGSLALNPVILGFSTLVPLGIVIARAAGRGRRNWEILAGLLWLSALILSLTRSAIFALPVMLLVVILANGVRQRLAVGSLVAVIVLLPLADAAGLGTRLGSTFDSSPNSTAGHIGALQQDFALLMAHPVGTGLGMGGLAGQRSETPGYVDTESWYFQVGTELGALGLLLYLWLQTLLIRGLWRRAREHDLHASGALAGLVGLAVGGIFLSSFGDLGVSWMIFTLSGLALSTRIRVTDTAVEDQQAESSDLPGATLASPA